MRVLPFFSLFLIPALITTAAAEEPAWRHGTTLIGDLKYPPGFKRFDYVKPDAPKGGQVRFAADGTFDTFNPYLPKGAPAAGIGQASVLGGVGYVYERLMKTPLDEPWAEYVLLAESLKFPDDFSWVTYRLNPKARWHDGKPITADDVVWSFDRQVEMNPKQRHYYRHITKAEVTGEREVTFTFDQTGNRELPQILGQLLVLPKHWWEGTDAKGNKRDIKKGTLEPPLGSGPYRVKSFVAGRSIILERVPDYWGADLNVNIGYYNFDEMRYEYYRDDTVRFEAFKADAYDWRSESTARNWAKGYDIPAVKSGRIIKQEFEEPYRSGGAMAGFIMNLRRAKLADPRVRRALNFAFDFESLNKDLFFGQYHRYDSYFDGIELESTGLPEGQELEILETVRDKVPPDVFTKSFFNPVTADAKAARSNLRKAFELLKEAGWTRQGNQLVNAETGEPLQLEYLSASPTFEKIALRYQASLKRLGITMNFRVVDSSQFINRVRDRDFDIIYSGWPQSNSPGNEQLDFFGSEAADKPASFNYAGIKNPAIDELIRRIIFAKDRAELIAATKAMDRVLLWNHYVVPGWTLRKARVARWDRFSHPDPLPYYSVGFPLIWWYDSEKAAKTGAPK